ncbi:MAG: carbohydrate kinase family protein [Gemmatimonadaceae bacterium]|nr:carbohydrate kinase family protein [Gemmatimonadaceae bacterium]
MDESGGRSGVIAGGNWIVDRVRIIDAYPEQDGLAHILGQSVSNGGSPYNLLKDLARLEAPFPLAGAGLTGADEEGRFILEDCRAHGIDVSRLRTTAAAATAYTDVMTVKSTGRRTFFYQAGTNGLLDHDDLAPNGSNARIFHLGYLLLLDRLDEIGPDGQTGAARLLRTAQSLGFRTSADVVSEDSGRVRAVVDPCLPAIDYFFLNEREAERITGTSTRRNESVDWDGVSDAAKVLIDRGVNEVVCVHCPEGALARTISGREHRQASVDLPPENIAGAVGAGDAFAAGVLLGLHEGWQLERSLQLGVCAAASSLLHPASSTGVLPWKECLKLGEVFGFRESGVR